MNAENSPSGWMRNQGTSILTKAACALDQYRRSGRMLEKPALSTFGKQGPPITAPFSSLLDGMRWIAAAIVALSHIRAMCWVDGATLDPTNYAIKALYAVTSMGVEAVAVFFVLSGFLVGGANYSRFLEGRFDVRRYSLDRITRIYAVLLPVLIGVALLDVVGRRWSVTAPSYTGGNSLILARYGVFPPPSLKTFWANLAALQDFRSPVFGSDVPLWSLSYEIWFYVIAGAILFAGNVTVWLRNLLLVGVFALTLALGIKFVFFLSLWLVGVAAHRIARRPCRVPMVARVAALGILPLSMLASAQLHLTLAIFGSPINPMLLPVAIACGFTLISWRHVNMPLLRKTYLFNRWAASFSFTLYLIHFPVALFVSSVLVTLFAPTAATFAGFQPLSYEGAVTFSASLACSIVISIIVAAATEWRTDKLRSWLSRKKPV